jgi:hypothetical protein
MMELSEIVALVPEDKRADVTTAISGVVKVSSREDAEKALRENQHFKSAFDAGISKAVASHDERFIAEKLPTLIEQEVAKKNPPKDARDQKIADLEKKFAESEKRANSEKQIALAISEAAKLGIPAELAKRFIGESDESTQASIAELFGVLKPWKEEAVKAEVLGRVGNMGTPPKGGAMQKEKDALMTQYNQLIKDGKRDEANRIYVRLATMKE